ncbi:MAG: hypothetical protein HY321_07125 [Armatimonadetes bacterium]|nr:hypothetical protein [Armatimonadota bacterium]
MNLSIAYCYDDDLRRAANAEGRNYWYRYVEEILDRLGATGTAIGRGDLDDAARLAGFSALIVGDLEAAQMPAGAPEVLRAWVEAGGLLIGFMTAGLDDVFGCRAITRVRRPGDDFCPSASFALTEHPACAGVHSTLHPEQRLIAIGDSLALKPDEGTEVVARLFNLWGASIGAAITARRLGAGTAFYFGIHVPQTFWAIQQGRPIDADYDGDGYLRSSDARVIGTNDPEVAYTDEILFLLANMLAVRPHPTLSPIPPLDGRPADLLLFWGGDDEHMEDVQLPASDWMRSRGLPYHINIMPIRGHFAVSREDFAHIRANGHEPSLHFNFIDDFRHPGGFTAEDVASQARAYREAFGCDPVCVVTHFARWVGWHEPAEWMAARGIKADNSHFHRGSPPLNPVNSFGFSFGTAYPFWFYSDWRDGNRRLDFLEEPITAYEMGYVQSNENPSFEGLRTILDLAARTHLTLNTFYHPVYIARFPQCRNAIDELLRYLEARRYRAVHMGNDEVWRWWEARSRGRITDARADEDGVSCTASCDYPGGFTLRVPCGERAPKAATCDGAPAALLAREEFGQHWAEVALPAGEHQLELRF